MSSKEIIAQILKLRGISDPETFLHPDFERDTHDPMLMKDMDKAVARLRQAMERKETVGIFGDYDADGVPATALLVRALTRLGIKTVPHIPTREAGYGLSAESVELLLAEKYPLLITVDNGTVSKLEIAMLQSAGTDVIVCDHHEPLADNVAAPFALLNPKQPDCTYPFKELCACAIAWKLASALYASLDMDAAPLKWEMDLVALSTIADMVPLLGENRVLATFGLKVLRKTRNLGLKELARVAGTELVVVTAGSVGFRLAPRINAPSRMHNETVKGNNAALQLLISDDAQEAVSLANYLDGQNVARQDLLEKELREAFGLVRKKTSDHCLVVYKPEWSSGVIGLLAGRLAEQFGRPVIVLTKEGNAIKGSVRSVNGINAVALMAAGNEFLERFGGHAKAGGLTLKPILPGEDIETVERFRQCLVDWTAGQGFSLEEMADSARRRPDLDLSLADISLELAEGLDDLQPFGIGFPTPLFATTCEVRSLRQVGREKQHLSLQLVQGGVSRKGIAFSHGEPIVKEGDRVRAEYTVQIEEWQNVRSPSCQVQRLVLEKEGKEG